MQALKTLTKENNKIYKCAICNRQTRNVRGDEGLLKQCLHCYELCGYDVMMQEGQKFSQDDRQHIDFLLRKLSQFADADLNVWNELKDYSAL